MINGEFVIFLIVGASAVLVDFMSYRGLIGFQFMEVDMAKATGFLVGTLFAYFANRFWTFGHKSRGVLGINALALKLLADVASTFQLAFLLATGVSACFNFLVMKFFVFKPTPASEFQ